MTKYFESEIESKKVVWLDGEKYIRVFYANSQYFDDVLAESYTDWLDATGNFERN
jgi:hypothetical protein